MRSFVILKGEVKLENVIFCNQAIPRQAAGLTGCTKRYEIIYINKDSCFLTIFS
jgi:hypothetical protein